MSSGERSQVWFPEIVALLRHQWRQDLSWQSVVELRDLLQNKLGEIRQSRGILPPLIRCRWCGHIGPAKPTAISVRSMLISVRRFAIDTIESIEIREHEWERFRRKNKLDLIGRSSKKDALDSCHKNSIRNTG
jgi:hypothetical protein